MEIRVDRGYALECLGGDGRSPLKAEFLLWVVVIHRCSGEAYCFSEVDIVWACRQVSIGAGDVQDN
uniref:Uncharacterized protein n=1 Tax=Solanum tuberosum TaxID=4113 RepID=M1DYB8_SOLTU